MDMSSLCVNMPLEKFVRGPCNTLSGNGTLLKNRTTSLVFVGNTG